MDIKEMFINEEKGVRTPAKKKIINVLVVLIAVFCVFYFSFTSIGYKWRWEMVYIYRQKFITGFIITIFMSLFSLILSLMLGILFALARNSKILFLNYFSELYVEVIRGTPMLVQILVFFYIVGTAFKIENRYLAGVLILSIFSAAYVTEIIRAGVESIESSQLETAKAIGFTNYQIYRYIIIPQVITRIMPPMAGQFASLVKDSSLLSVIAVNEFTKNVQEADSLNFATLENYIALAIGYLILTFPISMISKKLERKFHYEA